MSRPTRPGEWTGSDVMNFLFGTPALLGWLAYLLAWLLDPRMAGVQDPLQWAGAVALGYYMVIGLLGLFLS